MVRINPIFLREMRLRVRNSKFGISIFCFNLIMIIITLFAFEMKFNVNINENIDYSGVYDLFNIMVSIETLMVIFMVPSLTSISISSEREKQTLDILLSTGVNSYSIIIAKLAESISVIFIYVMSSLPIIALVFTIGGITGIMLFKFIIEIFVTSVFFGSLGVLSSVITKKNMTSVILTFAFVFFFCLISFGIIIGVDMLNSFFGGGSGFFHFLTEYTSYILTLNPIFDLIIVLSGQNYNNRLFEFFMKYVNVSETALNNWMTISVSVRLFFSAIIIIISQRQLKVVKGRQKS